MREQVRNPQHGERNTRRNLLDVPSFLHRQAEIRRYRRPNRKVPKEIRTGLFRQADQKRKESLAEYYYRTYQHLLNGISIFEVDITLGTLKEINAPEKKPRIQRNQ